MPRSTQSMISARVVHIGEKALLELVVRQQVARGGARLRVVELAGDPRRGERGELSIGVAVDPIKVPRFHQGVGVGRGPAVVPQPLDRGGVVERILSPQGFDRAVAHALRAVVDQGFDALRAPALSRELSIELFPRPLAARELTDGQRRREQFRPIELVDVPLHRRRARHIDQRRQPAPHQAPDAERADNRFRQFRERGEVWANFREQV